MIVVPTETLVTRRKHDLTAILQNIKIVSPRQPLVGLRAHTIEVDPYLEETMTPQERDALYAELQAVKVQEGS